MTFPLTPEVLAAAYDFVVATEPFCRWNLPDSDDVKFRVIGSRKVFATYHWEGRHVISVSSRAVGHAATLVEKMCHEVIHLHLEATGMESRSNDPNVHNAAFRKLAAVVCRTHGYDPKGFY